MSAPTPPLGLPLPFLMPIPITLPLLLPLPMPLPLLYLGGLAMLYCRPGRGGSEGERSHLKASFT